jgi:hypothetical protein
MKKPTWPEVCALAERTGVEYSVRELQRFTRDCAFPPDLIAKFWPKASARRQAFLQGQTRYHGSLCHRHDTTERYVSNCKCVDCCLAINRDVYHRDPDADKRRSAAWHRANREYRNVYQQANRQKNREARP